MVNVALILTYVVFTFAISYILVYTTKFHTEVKNEDKPILGVIVTFTSLVFSLLLGFTISNYYDTYFDAREEIMKESSELLSLYLKLKGLPETGHMINTLSHYVRSKVDEWDVDHFSGKTDLFHDRLFSQLVEYLRVHPEYSTHSLLEDISAYQQYRRRILVKDTPALVWVIILSAIITVIGFWYLTIDQTLVLYIVFFGVVGVILVSIFVLQSLTSMLDPSSIFYIPPDALTSLDAKIRVENPIYDFELPQK